MSLVQPRWAGRGAESAFLPPAARCLDCGRCTALRFIAGVFYCHYHGPDPEPVPEGMTL